MTSRWCHRGAHGHHAVRRQPPPRPASRPPRPPAPRPAQAAERLTFALDPAARLALMEAISQAAAEITAEMPTGGVDVRLNGRELDFVVAGRPARRARARPRRRRRRRRGGRGGGRHRPDHAPDARVGQGQGRGARRPLRPLAQHLAGQRRPRRHPRAARSTSTSTCPASRSSAATTPSAARARRRQPPDDRLGLTTTQPDIRHATPDGTGTQAGPADEHTTTRSTP